MAALQTGLLKLAWEHDLRRVLTFHRTWLANRRAQDRRGELAAGRSAAPARWSTASRWCGSGT
ncbi:hypothetical protein ACWGR4_40920 [Embleya sp. NPDC055664]